MFTGSCTLLVGDSFNPLFSELFLIYSEQQDKRVTNARNGSTTEWKQSHIIAEERVKRERSKKTAYGEMSKKLIPDQLMPRHLRTFMNGMKHIMSLCLD